VSVVGTPASVDWLNQEAVAALTGTPPRVGFRRPNDGKKGMEPDSVVMLPATFNTMNKLVHGIADNYATSLACSWMGQRKPLLVAPMVNDKLWGHPAFGETLQRLSHYGARFLNIQAGTASPAPVLSGTGEQVTDRFEPSWLVMAIKDLVDPHPVGG
jgi:phosphopantothenoylcysteine synthetase/decarboxylase